MVDDCKEKTQNRALNNGHAEITGHARKKEFDQKHDNDRHRTFNGQALPKRQTLPMLNQIFSLHDNSQSI